jgi:hypothetical protein
VKKTVCLDFDGVMNTYDGWKGEDELFEPRDGLSEFLAGLREAGFRVAVLSTRPAEKLRGWLDKYALAALVDDVVDRKPPAIAYLDDRAVRFDGDFAAALAAVKNFRTFWERSR